VGKPPAQLLHNVDEILPAPKLLAYGIQWVLFGLGALLTSSFFVGVSLGLSSFEIGELAQRMFLIMGSATVLQCFFGHRLPIIEGPAQAYWPMYAAFASSAVAGGIGLAFVRGAIESAFIIAGLMLAFLGLTGLIGRLTSLFTKPIIGSMLVIIAITIAVRVVPASLGVTPSTPQGNFFSTIVSIAVIVVIAILVAYSKGVLRSSSIIIGIAVGYVAFASVGSLDIGGIESASFVALPQVLAWGTLTFDVGVTLATILMVLIMNVNIVASVQAMEITCGIPADHRRVSRAVVIDGVTHILTGINASAALIPAAGSSGLVTATRVASRFALATGGGILILLGLVPKLSAAVGTVPTSVAMAATVTGVSLLLAIGLKTLSGLDYDVRESLIVGLSMVIGLGAGNLSQSYLSNLPTVLAPIIGNGVLMGTLTAILLEHVILPRRLSGRS
jgi:xanthine/uracil permease